MSAAPAAPNSVITRTETQDAEVSKALVWIVERRKVFAAIFGIFCSGLAAAWIGYQQIEASAEERVIRRQMAKAQSDAVVRNGAAVAHLGKRMVVVEAAIGRHTDMTRTSIELLMAHPAISVVLDGDVALRERAAKVVSSGNE